MPTMYDTNELFEFAIDRLVFWENRLETIKRKQRYAKYIQSKMLWFRLTGSKPDDIPSLIYAQGACEESVAVYRDMVNRLAYHIVKYDSQLEWEFEIDVKYFYRWASLEKSQRHRVLL